MGRGSYRRKKRVPSQLGRKCGDWGGPGPPVPLFHIICQYLWVPRILRYRQTYPGQCSPARAGSGLLQILRFESLPNYQVTSDGGERSPKRSGFFARLLPPGNGRIMSSRLVACLASTGGTALDLSAWLAILRCGEHGSASRTDNGMSGWRWERGFIGQQRLWGTDDLGRCVMTGCVCRIPGYHRNG